MPFCVVTLSDGIFSCCEMTMSEARSGQGIPGRACHVLLVTVQTYRTKSVLFCYRLQSSGCSLVLGHKSLPCAASQSTKVQHNPAHGCGSSRALLLMGNRLLKSFFPFFSKTIIPTRRVTAALYVMLGFVQRNVMGPQAQVPEMSGMGSCHMQLPFECGPQRKALAFQHKKRWVLQAPCVRYGCIAQQYTQPFCSALLHGSVVWSSSEIETIAKCLCAAEMSAGVTLGVSVARGMHCEPFKKENQIL